MKHLAIALGALLVAFCGMDDAKAQTQVQPYYGSPPSVSGGPVNKIPVDTTHGLPVNCILGCSGGGGGGLSVTDNVAFTSGISPFTPSGCEYNATPTTITSGNQGMFGCTPNRALTIDALTGTNISNLLAAPSTALAATAYNTNSYSNAATSALNTDLNGNIFTNTTVNRWANGTLGAMANYGTSPGTVLVPSVNAFVTNPITATANGLVATTATTNSYSNGASAPVNIDPNGATYLNCGQFCLTLGSAAPASSLPIVNTINVTPTNCSGTITTGATAQNAFGSQATLHGFTIANIDSTAGSGEPLWISFTTTAAPSTGASFPLSAPTATTFAGLSTFTSPTGFGMNTALSVVGATTGHKYSCTYW